MDASSEGQLSFNLNLDPSAQISTQQLPDDKLDQQKRNLHTTVVVDEQFKNQEGGKMNMNMNMMEVISRRVERESRRMTQMVADMFDKCSVMHHQLVDLILNPDNPINKIKRKAEHMDYDNHDGSCCNKRIRMINCKPKITTTFIRVDPSDAGLAVKDGYQWRKYGQKVTRDNPSPRAYFKCSFAPICPVKKKVQKSVEDPTVVVATYEGEHNHKQQQQPSTNTIHSSLINPSPSSYISSPSSSSSSSLKELRGGDIINEEDNDDDRVRRPLEHWLLHQMASSLTQDPSFTSTLAAAISHKLV